MCSTPSNSERTRRVTRRPASTSQIGSLQGARTRASSTGHARFRCGLGSSSIRRREARGLSAGAKGAQPTKLHKLVMQLEIAVRQNEPKIINVYREAQANCPPAEPGRVRADRVCARRAWNGRECRRDDFAEYGDECDDSSFSNLASRQRYLREQHGSPLR